MIPQPLPHFERHRRQLDGLKWRLWLTSFAAAVTSAAVVTLALMALSKEEREQFLAEPHIAALSVSAGDKRGPLTVPIWYQYNTGGEPWVLTGAGSRKHRLIETQGEFTLMVDRDQPTVRYVAVDGVVSRIEPGTDEHLVEITHRYMSGEAAEKYIDFARNNLGETVIISMRPQHWLSADLGGW